MSFFLIKLFNLPAFTPHEKNVASSCSHLMIRMVLGRCWASLPYRAGGGWWPCSRWEVWTPNTAKADPRFSAVNNKEGLCHPFELK